MKPMNSVIRAWAAPALLAAILALAASSGCVMAARKETQRLEEGKGPVGELLHGDGSGGGETP